MVLIPNTTGVESANTNVIGRRSSDVGVIADRVNVVAAVEDLFDESKRKQRRTKGCGRTT